MKRLGLLVFLLMALSMTLDASYFSTRRTWEQMRSGTVRTESEESDGSMASQVPDVKAKKPKIYGKKAEDANLGDSDLLSVTEEEEEEALPAPLEAEESFPAVIEIVAMPEDIVEEASGEPEEKPAMGKTMVKVVVVALSLSLLCALALSVRNCFPGPFSPALSLFCALMLVLFPTGLSVLAAGWSLAWGAYLLLLPTYFVFRGRGWRSPR